MSTKKGRQKREKKRTLVFLTDSSIKSSTQKQNGYENEKIEENTNPTEKEKHS